VQPPVDLIVVGASLQVCEARLAVFLSGVPFVNNDIRCQDKLRTGSANT
jgi:hypothetical protein